MIPLSLVTGFLGSGKTTLLQRVIEQNTGRGLAYVVNEFAETDVDRHLLEVAEEHLVSIAGGSIFCRCVSGDFVRVLQALPGRFGDPERPLEAVIIEASGIADPKVIAEMLEEHRLDRTYELRTIVSVIDPGTFLKLIDTLPNVAAQVEACSVAVVNKTDLHGEATLRRVEREIERINPQAKIVRATYCGTEIDIAGPATRQLLEGQYALCRDPHYLSATVPLDTQSDPGPLLAELRSIKDDVYRVKGFVPVPNGMIHVDVAAGRLNTRAVARADAPGELVLVFDPQNKGLAEHLIARWSQKPCGISDSAWET
jgi:G3E family GTPase